MDQLLRLESECDILSQEVANFVVPSLTITTGSSSNNDEGISLTFRRNYEEYRQKELRSNIQDEEDAVSAVDNTQTSVVLTEDIRTIQYPIKFKYIADKNKYVKWRAECFVKEYNFKGDDEKVNESDVFKKLKTIHSKEYSASQFIILVIELNRIKSPKNSELHKSINCFLNFLRIIGLYLKRTNTSISLQSIVVGENPKQYMWRLMNLMFNALMKLCPGDFQQTQLIFNSYMRIVIFRIPYVTTDLKYIHFTIEIVNDSHFQNGQMDSIFNVAFNDSLLKAIIILFQQVSNINLRDSITKTIYYLLNYRTSSDDIDNQIRSYKLPTNAYILCTSNPTYQSDNIYTDILRGFLNCLFQQTSLIGIIHPRMGYPFIESQCYQQPIRCIIEACCAPPLTVEANACQSSHSWWSERVVKFIQLLIYATIEKHVQILAPLYGKCDGVELIPFQITTTGHIVQRTSYNEPTDQAINIKNLYRINPSCNLFKPQDDLQHCTSKDHIMLMVAKFDHRVRTILMSFQTPPYNDTLYKSIKNGHAGQLRVYSVKEGDNEVRQKVAEAIVGGIYQTHQGKSLDNLLAPFISDHVQLKLR